MFTPTKEQAEAIAKQYGTPVFVADERTLIRQAEAMRSAFDSFCTKIFYSIKANSNPYIVRVLKDAGIYGIDAVSPFEVRLALDFGYRPEEIIYTPSNPSTEEIRMVGEWGVLQNLGSLSGIERYCKLFPGTEVSIRICPEVEAGECLQVQTGGAMSKFGLALPDVGRVKDICATAKVPIVGIHSHVGSGLYDVSALTESMETLLDVVRTLPDATFIDIGGGFGVSYRPNQECIDLVSIAHAIEEKIADFASSTGRELDLYIEPGKYLVAESTALVAKVTTIKDKRGMVFVGLDTGFNHLIRVALYDAYHHIVNLSRPDAAMRRVTVVGNLCESADLFASDIELPDPQEGDLLALLTAGGYGTSMSSTYNMRPLAAEVLIRESGEMELTRRRQTYEELMALYEPL